jgi:hypothetical protein
MFRATHTRHAPWCVVSFNDQRRGRLALIRHLLDQVPDTRVPTGSIELPPLTAKPKKERFRTSLRPINE